MDRPDTRHTHTHVNTQQPPTQVARRTMAGHGAAPPATGWEGEVRKVLKEDWQVRCCAARFALVVDGGRGCGCVVGLVWSVLGVGIWG